jgi:C4-type Zn-finger protein
MLNVCRHHVKVGIKNLNTPHVRKITDGTYTCSFCNKKAEIKIFYSIPYYKVAISV